ncbi:MAG: tetratricopeptide repeat protein, partial [Anaerolineae bacterium]|nr:tetratricopeptide repeat protein [Anaerolineae bacterium]
VGPGLLDRFVPAAPLLERARTFTPWPGDAGSLDQLENVVTRRAAIASEADDASVVAGLQQSALFEQYTRVLLSLAHEAPLVLALDDLQWADLGSISLLFQLGRHLAGTRILVVGAFRPEDVAIGRDGERHPLEPVLSEFQRLVGDIVIDLNRADSRVFVEALLDSEPNRLGPDFRAALHQRSQGHPLFTVELLRGMQDRGNLVRDSEGHWIGGAALDWETLPARVEAVLAERIGRLPRQLRDTLSVAGVEGETFTAEVVSRVQATGEREVVRTLSETLDRRHRLVAARGILRLGGQRLSQYRFRHNLYQQYLYRSLDPVEQVYLHEAVGSALEALYAAADADASSIAPQLAWHFEEAGISEKAIGYYRQAGERALQLSAYQEAILHLSRGLALLMALPDSPERERQELDLQLALAVAWQGTEGTQSTAMKETYSRALELCLQMDNRSQLCRVLGELALHYYVRAEYQTARRFAEQALSVAEGLDDTLLAALSRWYLGVVLFGLGEFTTAHAHLERVVDFYDPERHHKSFVLLRGSDAGVSAMAYTACTLWCLGYPEQAQRRSQEALALARALGHPFSLADVLCYAGCMFSEMRRDAQELQDQAEALMQLSSDKVPVWLPMADRYRGGALFMLGHVDEGIALMRRGMASNQPGGVRCCLSESLCSLAKAQARAGQPEQGLITVAEALAFVQQTDEHHSEAELYRVRAELARMLGKDAEAEASLQKAIEVARRQEARSWELRATTSLARLWQAQGKVDEACDILRGIYGWFTEGLGTPDVQEAAALLQELASSHGPGSGDTGST